MSALSELLAYNAWANTRTFEACRGVATDATGSGVTRSLLDLLRHLMSVELNYLALMRGEPRTDVRTLGMDELVERSRSVTAEYERFVAATDPERVFNVPWLEQDLTVTQGLLQMLTHSIQHRADIATLLTQHGATAPALDFVVFTRGN